MPGRTFNAGSYAYGFNGKRMDNEVSGTGNQYDYGFRIYDPRLVRFKSVDPVTNKYPELTPYQFASNSPISGIDLDGLEYLASNVARIEVSRGYVYLKMSNMHNVTQNTYNAANANSNFWSQGPDGKKGIGISLKIGSTDFDLFTPKFNPEIFNATDNSFGAPDVNFQPGKIGIEKGTAASTGVADRRLKDRAVNSASPVGVARLAKASVAIDALIIGSNLLKEYQVNEDINLARKHFKVFEMAEYDVNQALLRGGVIPKEYQTEEKLSDITNVVLSGVSNLNDKKILEIGKNIYNQFSKQRQKYDGTMNITGPDGMVIKNIPKPNPIYNPDYGK